MRCILNSSVEGRVGAFPQIGSCIYQEATVCVVCKVKRRGKELL